MLGLPAARLYVMANEGHVTANTYTRVEAVIVNVLTPCLYLRSVVAPFADHLAHFESVDSDRVSILQM